MEKTFNINATLTDTSRNNRKVRFYVTVDTVSNRIDIVQLKAGAIDEKKDSDAQMEKIFGERPSYHMEVLSDLLVDLVDQLGGIEVKGKQVDGKKAFEMADAGELDDVCDGVLRSLRKKNLLLTLPSLLSSLNANYRMDLSVGDLIKLVLSEVGELNDWKVSLKKMK